MSNYSKLIKGRGTVSNRSSTRIERRTSEFDGDWLDQQEIVDGALPRLRTEVTIEKARTIITRNLSPDIPFDRSINAYRGCEHGCVYCFARPTHAYMNLSPGLDFESRLFAKPDAPNLLAKELAADRYECRPIALGTNTDPYQPIEERFCITRGILEVLEAHGHPVTITTKSARVLRDVDILARMAARGLAFVVVSVTTLDAKLARSLEPRASAPEQRLRAITGLSGAGVPVHVAVSPCIPALTDHELEAILGEAAKAGACGAYSLLVRLPYEVAPLFQEWLQIYRPLAAERVMGLIRAAREGRDNEPAFHKRFSPSGPYAAAIRARFVTACKRLRLSRVAPTLRTELFAPPGPRQLSLV